MSADEHSTTAVVAAFFANLGIAIMKFIGFAFTGSGAMLAEAVHSVADTGNEGLLLLGGHKSKRMADVEHPFGYGRERYFWAFVVSVLLFSVGGLFSIFDGVEKLLNPHELESIGWAIGILLGAMVLELFSFRTAIRSTRRVKGNVGWWRFIRTAKTPELPVVLLEDLAALIGLTIALAAVIASGVSGDTAYDAIGSLAIGALLVVIAAILAVEMRSLLLGESASPDVERRIIEAMEGGNNVCRVIHIRTEHLGPEELLVAAKVEFDGGLSTRALADVINEVEAAVREDVPEARVIYLEPDVVRSG
ncbi:MAG TPA: cation diffusion facilitator family transporter [Acidimicrobiales bacterium]|jgi:cation diffusion facilitator family transporter|nr:cation diffusion facilitator family transporter [Acidimicrobiales bacterium]